MLYLWLKVIHIFAVIAWMAGLFYLPRLFVYHTNAKAGSEMDQTFKTMERRLIRGIMRPAALVTILAGIGTVEAAGFSWSSPWLSFKLLGVLGLIAYHGFLEASLAQFKRGERRHSERFWRFMNEVPALLLIWIIIFVVVKPFS
jgi:putative membrane protein